MARRIAGDGGRSPEGSAADADRTRGTPGDDDRYDAIVLGVGGMGSAAVYHLTRRGLDVLGIERFDVPHDRGSSHGYTRIFRLLQHERPAYVPLARRARELWRDLEAECGEALLHTTGSVTAGPAGADPVASALDVCEAHGLDHEHLTGAEMNDRHPGYALPPDHGVVYQPDGGFLAAERSIVAHARRATARGATIRARERVREWTPTAGGVRVETDAGTYAADDLVVAAGAWTPKLVDALGDHLSPQRRIMAWFQPHEPDRFAPDAFPVFSLVADGEYFYGFPVYEVPGFKLGWIPDGPKPTDPDDRQGDPTPEEERVHRRFAERYFPEGAGPTSMLRACMTTHSPDGDFVLDTHPDHPQVTVAAGFSGNGFKFCSVVGEVVADLVVDGATDHDVGMCGFDRL
ncbi:N-methyl-L-tryptophan oxidase [Halobacteriales archaeon QS_1_68_17]|nr:MAG: N-methyl-L-tryptophan oxidase [Halobacteriales archaeon QS_1_68_17]